MSRRSHLGGHDHCSAGLVTDMSGPVVPWSDYSPDQLAAGLTAALDQIHGRLRANL
jgi:hypothetical protein